MPKLLGIRAKGPKSTVTEYLLREDLQDPKKLIVEAPEGVLRSAAVWARLDEATRAKVGRYQARRDPPHFQGDEYHGHAKVPGGYEVSWNISGSRRHRNKFPGQVPNDARAAVAAVLGVDPAILEGSKVYDRNLDRIVYLIEVGSGDE